MALISSEQSKRGGLGFDTGDDASSPGYIYARGPPNALDLHADQANPNNGLVKQKAFLNTKGRLNVPTLNAIPIERLKGLNLPQYAIITGGITSTDSLLDNMVSSMEDAPKQAARLSFVESFVTSSLKKSQPTPSSDASSIPRNSATSRTVAGVSRAAANAVKGLIASRALSAIITVAVLCGGMCTVGGSEISTNLNLGVIH